MLAPLKRIYLRQMFFPGPLGIFVNPFYIARAGLVSSIRKHAPELGGRLVDIGCGQKPYRELFKHVDSYTGLDIDSPQARMSGVADDFYDGRTFPYVDGRFDSALCSEVLEHIFTPDEFLAEIRRVMKPDGLLLLTVPFVWDEHMQPHDFRRYTSFGLAALLLKNGFEPVRLEKVCANAGMLFQLANAYLYKITDNWPRPVKLLFTATVMAAMTAVGLLFGRIMPSNADLYLDLLVIARRLP